MPPPNAYKKLSTEPIDLDVDLPEGGEGSYRIELPPNYHHGRPHPVLMLMHGRELPELLMLRWKALAAENGFILMTPRWLNPAAPGVLGLHADDCKVSITVAVNGLMCIVDHADLINVLIRADRSEPVQV